MTDQRSPITPAAPDAPDAPWTRERRDATIRAWFDREMPEGWCRSDDTTEFRCGHKTASLRLTAWIDMRTRTAKFSFEADGVTPAEALAILPTYHAAAEFASRLEAFARGLPPIADDTAKGE